MVSSFKEVKCKKCKNVIHKLYKNMDSQQRIRCSKCGFENVYKYDHKKGKIVYIQG